MTVRVASARDFTNILQMFDALLKDLERAGNTLYTHDPDQYVGGIAELVALKMNDPNSIVLVNTDQNDKAQGFLIGWVIEYPKFFKDYRLGEIQWMWPLAFPSAAMSRFFDAWAQQRGATGKACYGTATYPLSHKIFERHGFKVGLHHFYKSYKKE